MTISQQDLENQSFQTKSYHQVNFKPFKNIFVSNVYYFIIIVVHIFNIHNILMSIRKLPEDVINKIAAGQILQRPSNAIKELVENSIDAGATAIKILILQGGIKQIRISDNGDGIALEDFSLVCQRFATSKIKSYEDLKQVESFGFRGEALASLSYVAKVEIISKRKGQLEAYRAEYKDSKMLGEALPHHLNKGTTIVCRDMFSQMPTRKQSLRAIQQKKLIIELIGSLSIHLSHIKFRLESERGCDFTNQGNVGSTLQDKLNIFAKVCSISPNSLFNYKSIINGVEVEIILTKLMTVKDKILHLFINNRKVESKQMSKAIENVYGICYKCIHETKITFAVYLSLQMKSKLIDCNVHPTKKIVQFGNSEILIEELKKQLQTMLKQESSIKKVTIQSELNITNFSKSKNYKTEYAYQKNRTDSKQIPLQYFFKSQPESIINTPNNTNNTMIPQQQFNKLNRQMKIIDIPSSQYDRQKEKTRNLNNNSIVEMIQEHNSSVIPNIKSMQSDWKQQGMKKQNAIMHEQQYQIEVTQQVYSKPFHTIVSQQQKQGSQKIEPESIRPARITSNNHEQPKKYTFHKFIHKQTNLVNQRIRDMNRDFFRNLSYIGYLNLNYLLVQFNDKMFLLNILPFIQDILFASLNESKQINAIPINFNIYQEMEKFRISQNLLFDTKQYCGILKSHRQILEEYCRIIIQYSDETLQNLQNMRVIQAPIPYEDVKSNFHQKDFAYFIAKTAKLLSDINNSFQVTQLQQLLLQFLSSYFQCDSKQHFDYCKQLRDLFECKLIPIAKIKAQFNSNYDITNYVAEVIDLKNLYKIFERC